VLRTLDGWGYVGAGERSGWVSMRFLAPNPPPENKSTPHVMFRYRTVLGCLFIRVALNTTPWAKPDAT
jgi:hypothetical protein